jgi:hypothetical protein
MGRGALGAVALDSSTSSSTTPTGAASTGGGDADVGGSGGGPSDGKGVPARRLSVGRVVILAVVLGLVGMWGYVLFLAFGPGRQAPVDRLEDPSFGRAAEEECAAALDDVEALPRASEAATAGARADVVEDANRRFGVMLTDLEGLEDLAPAGEQRERVGRWLADWQVYLEDRQAFVSDLRSDPSARLLVSEKPGTGRHITEWIDEFADANRMPSCASPGDV